MVTHVNGHDNGAYDDGHAYEDFLQLLLSLLLQEEAQHMLDILDADRDNDEFDYTSQLKQS